MLTFTTRFLAAGLWTALAVAALPGAGAGAEKYASFTHECPGRISARAPRPATRLRALVVGDTNAAGIGPSVRLDVENVTALLRAGLPDENRLHLTVMQGDEATADNLRK